MKIFHFTRSKTSQFEIFYLFLKAIRMSWKIDVPNLSCYPNCKPFFFQPIIPFPLRALLPHCRNHRMGTKHKIPQLSYQLAAVVQTVCFCLFVFFICFHRGLQMTFIKILTKLFGRYNVITCANYARTWSPRPYSSFQQILYNISVDLNCLMLVLFVKNYVRVRDVGNAIEKF